MSPSLRYESQMTFCAESQFKANFAQLEQLHPDRQLLYKILHLRKELVYLSSYFLLLARKEVANLAVLLVCSEAARSAVGSNEHH